MAYYSNSIWNNLSWKDEDILKHTGKNAINCGFWGFKKEVCIKLSNFVSHKIKHGYEDTISKFNLEHCFVNQGRYEQSLFNEFIFLENFYDELLLINDFVINITDQNQLEKIVKESEKIYHFLNMGKGAAKSKFLNMMLEK